MKRFYTAPEIRVEELETEDILLTSGGASGGGSVTPTDPVVDNPTGNKVDNIYSFWDSLFDWTY